EILTTLALTYLSQRCDRLVIEVGMGGRLDATNVLDLGIAVITNVALDHQRYLGESIEKIAAEKAGIIKPGNLVITGAEGAALEVIEASAGAAGARLWRLGQELNLTAANLGWRGSEIDVEGPGFAERGLRVPLLGSYQAANAALAELHRLNPRQVIFTAAADTPRAARPQDLAATWGGGETLLPAAAAVGRAAELAGPEGLVLVCGSLYLVGEVRPGLVAARR